MKRLATSGARTFSTAVPWLLVLLMLAGQLGVAAHPVTPESAFCGSSCPCESIPADQCCVPADPGCSDEATESDHCPAGCPECNCCPGLVMGLLPAMVPGLSLRASACAPPALPDAPVCGHLDDIFRPPRAHT